MKLFAAGLGLLVIAGCTERVNVTVNCLMTAKGAECTLVQVKGKTEVEACWDFVVTCGNGGVVTADRACAKVGDGATVQHLIPSDHIHGGDTCAAKAGTPPRGTITHLTLNGEQTDQQGE
jgi:hypothetical protein